MHRSTILDSGTDPEFDAVVALVAAICRVPVARVNFIDADRLYVKASFGMPVSDMPREQCFCAHAILTPDELCYVPDMRADERFADSDFVVGEPGFRFYAALPIVSRDGFALGTVCLVDFAPRELAPHEIEALELARRAVAGFLDQRRMIAELHDLSAEQQRIERRLRDEIVARRHIESHLAYASQHDSLTRLSNRSHFVEGVGAALVRAAADPRERFAVCVVDVDRFKLLNDRLGHSAGDAVLVEVGRRLSTIVRATDIVSRLSGDEFALLVGGADRLDAADAVAARIAAVMAPKFLINGEEVAVTASVGIVPVERADHSAESIMRDADVAVFAAKERGRNRHVLYDPLLGEQFARASEMHAAVRSALDRGRLRLAYQPIVGLTGDTSLQGFEALLRWDGDDGVVVSAQAFIGAAEQSGLIVEIGDWVLREACLQAVRWQRELGADVPVAVNVSARQLAEPDFAAKCKAVVRETGLDPRLLALEVTETMLVADVEASIEIMHDLRRFGIEIVLDDFGTGYSSLNYLRRFPLDRIKIDRSFISGAPGPDVADPIIVHAIVSLAHKLDLAVIAEGVETEAQRNALAAIGCEAAQGYLYAPAVTPAQAAELAARHLSAASESAA